MATTFKDATGITTTQKTKLESTEHIPYVALNPEENIAYSLSTFILPTTVTIGVNYLSFQNKSPTKQVKIKHISMIGDYAGTAAAARSRFVLKKYTGGSATTGTVISVTPHTTLNTPSIVECKGLATGLTLP